MQGMLLKRNGESIYRLMDVQATDIQSNRPITDGKVCAFSLPHPTRSINIRMYLYYGTKMQPVFEKCKNLKIKAAK